MIRSRRLALVALVFTFGIAACGDPTSTAPLASKPKVIQLAAGASRNATEIGAGRRLHRRRRFEDRRDGADRASCTTASCRHSPSRRPRGTSPPGQQPDLDRIAKLAAAFGITGDVRTLPTDQGGGWAVGPEDYSGPVLTVGSDGMLSWWLSGTPSAVGVGCAVPGTAPAAESGDAATSGAATDVAVPAGPAPDATPPGTIPCRHPGAGVPNAATSGRGAHQGRSPRQGQGSVRIVGIRRQLRTSSTSRTPTSGTPASTPR